MAKRYSKADRRLRQTQKRHQQLKDEVNRQLAQFDDQLYELLARYHFYHDTIDAVTQRDNYPARWHFGLSANHQTLKHTADTVLTELEAIRQAIKAF